MCKFQILKKFLIILPFISLTKGSKLLRGDLNFFLVILNSSEFYLWPTQKWTLLQQFKTSQKVT